MNKYFKMSYIETRLLVSLLRGIMEKFKSKLQSIHKKFYSKVLYPLCGIFGLFIIFGLYCVNGHSMLIDSALHTSTQAVEKKTDESAFNSYLEKLFQNRVTSNTLNLHYTLADPSSAHISEYPITFGEISNKSEAAQMAALENMQKELQTYDTSSMSKAAQMAYDILEDSIARGLELAPYYYYDELLSSTNGVQSEYPILLAEYTFHSAKDVEDYLNLLSQYDTFFEQVCEFEKQKAKRGLFMNKTAVENLIKQCRAFIPGNSEKSFWETTFKERLNKIKDLSDKEKKSYIKQNQEMLQDHVYPAYHNLIAVLKALKKNGKNPQGLCYFEDGKTYYQILVKSTTGSDHTIPELQEMVVTQRDACLTELNQLASKLTQSTSSSVIKRNNNSDRIVTAASYSVLPYHSPEEMLEHLKTQINTAFPATPEVNYSVKNVNEKLQDFLSPAFYLTAPMDQFTENCIYINPGNDYNDIQLFTTLAHEGYPGHLYQTVYSYANQLNPIRYLLYHGGYTEGWATYVEMLSYHYAGIDTDMADALMLNQDATLSLYATIDMGVHYDGWTLADTVDFLSGYGITQTSVISNIYQTIIENPANYLKYYIGYLEFLDLKKQAKSYYGNDYSELLFHTAVLDMGSAPFYILEKYFAKYYDAAK